MQVLRPAFRMAFSVPIVRVRPSFSRFAVRRSTVRPAVTTHVARQVSAKATDRRPDGRSAKLGGLDGVTAGTVAGDAGVAAGVDGESPLGGRLKSSCGA